MIGGRVLSLLSAPLDNLSIREEKARPASPTQVSRGRPEQEEPRYWTVAIRKLGGLANHNAFRLPAPSTVNFRGGKTWEVFAPGRRHAGFFGTVWPGDFGAAAWRAP